MAEKKSVGHAYNVDFLNVVFAASSLFLFLSVVWMVWDDYNREWKQTQRHFVALQMQVTEAQRTAAANKVDKSKLAQVQAQLKAAEQSVAANQKKVDDLQAKLKDADRRLFRATADYQYMKATYDQDRYDFEATRDTNPGASSVAKKQKIADEEAVRLETLNLAMEKVQAEKGDLQKQLGQYTGQVATLQKQLEEMNADQARLTKQIDVIAPSLVKDYFRNAPLLDFMAPTLKVQQIILPNVVDDVNFIRVPKMDRCQTCHLAIDKKGYEKYPQPYTTHPNLELYLGGSSPHPIDRVGCTVCHEGMGQSVSFRDAAHTPATPKQMEDWEKKYGWEQPHLWDFPMLPTTMTQASCAKCHKQEIYVPHADSLNIAYATFERAGCYACHKTKGFDTNIKKPGPILTKIDAKLSPEWVKTWIRNPRAVKPTTWMPRFFYNSNNSSPEDAVRNEAEINAIAAYLFANSEKYEPAVKSPPRGDPKSGEQIVKSIGCQGCHVVGEGARDQVGPHRTFGQPLENIGNKTTYEWIFDWVRDPKHYNPNTYMPNLRLTDQQAADVASYLVTLKGAGGDAPKATADAGTTDAVLLDYLKNVMPLEEARTTLSQMDPQARQVELGRRAISRYGCFSCHDIKGFETAQPIGTDLSEEGTKLVTRLDFAFVSDIPHTSKIAWFRRKLHDPRIFDRGRVLQPLDKLRMPNFELSDVEIDRLVTAIMSFQREIQPPAAMPVRSARYDYEVSGRTLVHRRNCVGCHIIEGDGGDFVKLVADPSLGPPMLTPEGARVQPDWLYAFLRGPITIRPWLNVRMPTFGLDDPSLNGVIRYFGAVSNTVGPFHAPQVVNASNTNDATGKALFEKLKCQQCHVLGAIPKDQPTSNLAPDLRMAPERLNADWILQWLKKPSDILPGTRMPAFWPDYPKSYYPELNGDAEAQIQAIRNHLLTFKGGPSPKTGGLKSANNE
ncbi:MAG TPA: c-type cytochrome [Vicinamibacterales bacterium]|jgi:mono/diheme cytochrome c family protein|nr:c-type cytochrome [Vicinamibacterales bacterium]